MFLTKTSSSEVNFFRKHFESILTILEMIFPAIYSLFELRGVSIESLKSNIRLGVAKFKSYTQFLNKTSWKYVFKNMLSPFTQNCIQVMHDNS